MSIFQFNKHILLIVASIFLLSSCSPFRQMNNSGKPLDVLIITDNRKFNREAFFAMFDSFNNIRRTEKKHPQAIDFIGSDSIKTYDAVVFYDMPENVVLTQKQKQNLIRFFESGAPIVFLHHSILSYREWDLFPEILGGRYYGKTPLITKNGDTIRSTYRHNVPHKITIADRKHPITKGVKDFEIMDEVYKNYFVKNDVQLLLTTDHPESGRELGWINKFGDSQIVFLMNGHDEHAYNNLNYRILVENAIHWVSENRHE